MLNNRQQVDPLLLDDYQLLTRYAEGKKITKIVKCTGTQIVLLLEDGVELYFSHLEDELIFDIELPLALKNT
jgi:hypothetical protein